MRSPGKLDLARQNYEKAIAIGTERDDPNLPAFKAHLTRLAAKADAKDE